MENKKIRLDKIVALTKELFHAHYAGKSEAWFSYLTSDSIFLGTGSPILIGKNSIENHFKVFHGFPCVDAYRRPKNVRRKETTQT